MILQPQLDPLLAHISYVGRNGVAEVICGTELRRHLHLSKEYMFSSYMFLQLIQHKVQSKLLGFPMYKCHLELVPSPTEPTHIAYQNDESGPPVISCH